jgi:hypothetical protein
MHGFSIAKSPLCSSLVGRVRPRTAATDSQHHLGKRLAEACAALRLLRGFGDPGVQLLSHSQLFSNIVHRSERRDGNGYEHGEFARW